MQLFLSTPCHRSTSGMLRWQSSCYREGDLRLDQPDLSVER